MALLRSAIVAALVAVGVSAQTTDDQRIADIQYVATELPKLHANFFFQLSPADFNAAVQSLTHQVSSLTDAEFQVRLAQLVAMAGDSHTAMYFNTAAFPLTFKALDDGMFVTSAATPYARALGAKLVKVGNTDIAAVITQLGTVIPHTNSQWVQFQAQSYLREQAVLQGLDLVKATESSTFTFQDSTGNQFALDLAPSTLPRTSEPDSQGPLPVYAQNGGQNYWFTYFKAQKVLYFKYNVCADDPANPFVAFAANLLNTFDSNPVNTLVFDFRGNTGGDSSLLNPVLTGIQQRLSMLLGNPDFQTYDVIDRGTFSSGLDDAMEIKSNTLAYASLLPGLGIEKLGIVIGQPSGGPPSGYGEVKPFTLPYFGLSGQYSTVFHPLQPFIPAGDAFHPDVVVGNRSTDYFARHDPVLAAIFARAGSPPAPASGNTIVVSGATFRTDSVITPGSYAAAFGAFPGNVDEVLINGKTAQIGIATGSQINFVLPSDVTAGQATISVRAGGAEVSTGQFMVRSAGLELFGVSSDPSQPGAVLNSDNSLNTESAPTAQNGVLQIFGTGLAQSTQVFVGNTPANVLYSGSTGEPGLWQINATVPAGVTGQIPVFAIAGNNATNAVTVWAK